MANETTNKILAQFRSEIRARLGTRLKKIILFGSKARGDDSPESDYDCLAICDEVDYEVKNTIDELAGELLYEHNAVFSIFPISETAYLRNTLNPLLMNVRREGKIIYG